MKFKTPTPSIKRLFLDIETSPNIVTSWRIGYKINIFPENIVEERKIICVSWKWEGSPKVSHLTWDKKTKDDKKLIQEIVKIIDKADEIVYQNGDRFDLPWIKTRAIFHGIFMAPKYQTFDTLKKVKSSFYFNSNKLDYIQKYLGGKGKLETGFNLWKRVCLDGELKALNEMVSYCDNDVLELESFYNKIIKYVPHNTHVGSLMGRDKYTCAGCGSHQVSLTKTRYTAMGTIRRQMQCQVCHTYFTISDSEYRKFIKENR